MRRLGAFIGAAATLVGLISGGIAIVQYLHRNSGPPTFRDSIDTATGVTTFLPFVDASNGQVVRLDTQCLYHQRPRVCTDWADSLGHAVVIIDLNTDPSCPPDRTSPCPGSTVLYFYEKDTSEAQVDNGQYGAGNIVVHGYFTISKRGNLGTLPPTATAIYLTAVPADQVHHGG
jgi:hypothetical protein